MLMLDVAERGVRSGLLRIERWWRKGNSRQFVAVAFVAVIGGFVGSWLVISSHAATSTAAIEAENMTLATCASKVADATASNASAVQFTACGTSVATAQDPLPYDMATTASLRSSGKKVFVHYFTPYPISLDNAVSSSDYYANGYLSPSGENGIHASYGGFLRERPLPRAVDPSSSWQLDDMKTEVQRATTAGLDGFTVDILGLSDYNWDRVNLLMQAASQADPGFKLMLMPDGTAGATSDPTTLANAMAGLAKGAYGNSLYRLSDGRLVISPFDPENRGLAFWQTFLSAMSAQGVNVAFVPCFLNYGANAAGWASISYGSSNWGDRTPANNQNLASNITDAHNRGKIWMQPVSLQDTRPKVGAYYESNNTENFRLTWQAAISGADWVQIPTWNDYSETTEISPSSSIGWSPLDINGYYLQRFKQGSYPQIKRDVIYVSHRLQKVSAPITGGQTVFMQLVNGSPARDTVEVLSFLTAPQNITVKIGASTQTYAAPAGVYAQTYPLASGTISASINYANGSKRSVTSPYTVTDTRAVQNFTYQYVGSGRDGTTTP